MLEFIMPNTEAENWYNFFTVGKYEEGHRYIIINIYKTTSKYVEIMDLTNNNKYVVNVEHYVPDTSLSFMNVYQNELNDTVGRLVGFKNGNLLFKQDDGDTVSVSIKDVIDNFHLIRETNTFIDINNNEITKDKIKVYTYCDVCGRLEVRASMFETDDNVWCSKCKPNLVKCDVCGKFSTTTIDEDGIHYCRSCYNKNYIYDYHHHKKDTSVPFLHLPEENEHKSRYYGIELEVQSNRNNSRFLSNTLPLSCESDCSINEGFETVWHPMTFDYIKSKEDYFKDIFSKFSAKHINEDNSCGMHIHVSRKDIKPEHINRMILFMETYKKEIVKLSRRKDDLHYCNWYSNVLEDDLRDIKKYNLESIDKAVKKNNYDRYMCINLTNANTIEFRIFKTTTDFKVFMSNLEFVKAVVDMSMSDKDITEFSFDSVIKDTKYLKAYCTEKGISNDVKIKETSAEMAIEELREQARLKKARRMLKTIYTKYRKAYRDEFNDIFMSDNVEEKLNKASYLCSYGITDLRYLSKNMNDTTSDYNQFIYELQNLYHNRNIQKDISEVIDFLKGVK